MSVFRPMLAPRDVPANRPGYFEELPYPLFGSPKVDGIRSVVIRKGAYSRSGKLLPSYQVQEDYTPTPGLDGELTAGEPNVFGVYNKTMSAVMSRDKPTDLVYSVFDMALPEYFSLSFEERFVKAENAVKALGRSDIRILPHTLLKNADDVLEFEKKCLADKYEGAMLRTPWGYYKNNRATWLDQLVYKLKRYEDVEAIVVDVIEAQENINEAEEDELGFTKRSDTKDAKAPLGRVGKFVVDYLGTILYVSGGSFTHAELKEIWENQPKYLGSLLKFRFMLYGQKNVPRHCRALGWRHKMDM